MQYSRAVRPSEPALDWDQWDPQQVWGPGPGPVEDPWGGVGADDGLWPDDPRGQAHAGPAAWLVNPVGYYDDQGRWVEQPAAYQPVARYQPTAQHEPMARYWDLDDADQLDDLGDGDPYAYGRARLPPPEPEPLPAPVGLNLREKWEATRDWLMAASGLAETEPGIDRGFRLAECALSVIYFWFGFLKLFPNVSPAEQLAGRTIEAITLHSVAPRTGAFALGLFEAAVAGLLMLYTGNRWVLRLIFLHLCGTFLPFLLFPGETFGRVPGSLTLTGQYIVKNLVLLGVVWLLLLYHGAVPSLRNDLLRRHQPQREG